MDEKKEKETLPQEPTVYATPVQRVWAWVGVAYVVLLTLLTTYGVARGGEFLRGIGGLMVAPALAGGGVTALLRAKGEAERGRRVLWCVLTGLALLLAVAGLAQSVPALLSKLRG